MLRRFALALVLVIAAGSWLAVPAGASAADVSLLADPLFESVGQPSAGSPWACTGDSSAVTDGGPVIGSEFTQLVGERDGTSPSVVPPAPVEAPRQLLVRPSAASGAGCAQVVPVQPNSAYQLRISVNGGVAVLGTEFGTVTSRPSTRYKSVAITFTTGPAASSVTVSVRGVPGGDPFYAENPELTGPASTVRTPAPPTALRTDRQTSTSVRLAWRDVPGATGYTVLRNGFPVATTTAPTALVTGLTPGGGAQLVVTALNPAGESAGSAPLQLSPVPTWSAAPDRPTGVTATAGRRGTATIELTAPARVTDGYLVYVDGGYTGWMYDSPARLLDLTPGQHTITVRALNVAGASAASDPVTSTGDGAE
ncbi:MAG: hypothetical protein QOD41_795 [Cryptosporangiaceae bacterium]|nr:hypothetical protein [Cryptosporangiaceae bacterium]